MFNTRILTKKNIRSIVVQLCTSYNTYFKKILSVNMNPFKEFKCDHNLNRKKICVVCFAKKKSVIAVKKNGELYKRIKNFVHNNLNFNDPRYPTGLCQGCKKTLFLIEQGKKSAQDLPEDKFDPTQISMPSNTR